MGGEEGSIQKLLLGPLTVSYCLITTHHVATKLYLGMQFSPIQWMGYKINTSYRVLHCTIYNTPVLLIDKEQFGEFYVKKHLDFPVYWL